MKSQFLAKIPVLPIEKFPVSCITQECDNVTTYYPVSALLSVPMVAYRRLETKENFKLSVLKVVAGAYERWPLTRGSKYIDLT